MRLCRIFLSQGGINYDSEKYKRLMNRRKVMKQIYITPIAEIIPFAQSLNLLVSVSVEAGIEDWEEGDEL